MESKNKINNTKKDKQLLSVCLFDVNCQDQDILGR